MLVGLSVLVLPETVHRALPQTIEDVERWSSEDKEAKMRRGQFDEGEVLSERNN